MYIPHTKDLLELLRLRNINTMENIVFYTKNSDFSQYAINLATDVELLYYQGYVVSCVCLYTTLNQHWLVMMR